MITLRASQRGLAFVLACTAFACSEGEPAGSGDAAPVPAEEAVVSEVTSALRFIDATAASGLDAFVQVNGTLEKLYITETVGAGVALFDADGDGDLDAYLSNGSSHAGFAAGEEPRDALFLNDGSGHFTDATEAAGLGDTEWTNGVRVVDYDGDGVLDIYLTNYGPNKLYRGVGDGRFEDVTARSGLGDARWSTGSAFFDFDRDGDLDVYVVNYVDFDIEWIQANAKREDYQGVSVMFGPRGLPGEHDAFYINQGDGTFREASQEVGIAGPAYFGFNAVVFDYDLDGWQDLYVANDSEANLLWRNEEGKGFKDVGLRAAVAMNKDGAKQAGMGAALGDYDGDLVPDLFVTNFAEDYFTLYRGSTKGWFTDASTRSRVATITSPMLGWGCGFVDFDFDGDEDLYAVNGHVYPQVDLFDFGLVYKQKNVLLENTGDGKVRRAPGGPGFDVQAASRGTAEGDVDGDGDIDLLIGNIDGPPTLLLNETESLGGTLVVRLHGALANTAAIGARVLITVEGREQVRYIGTQSGFLSSHEPVERFGLGDAELVESVVVTWPSGDELKLQDVPAGRLLVIDEVAGLVSSEEL